MEPEEVSELDPLELDPLPELETLPESEPTTSPCGALPAVELLPHAPDITTRHTKRPVIAERGRTPVKAVSMLTPSSRAVARIDQIRHASVGMLERSSGDRQIRSGWDCSSKVCSAQACQNPSSEPACMEIARWMDFSGARAVSIAYQVA
jgi:hypothetical protein